MTALAKRKGKRAVAERAAIAEAEAQAEAAAKEEAEITVKKKPITKARKTVHKVTDALPEKPITAAKQAVQELLIK